MLPGTSLYNPTNSTSMLAELINDVKGIEEYRDSIQISRASYGESQYREISQKEHHFAQMKALNSFLRPHIKLFIEQIPVMKQAQSISAIFSSNAKELVELDSAVASTSHENSSETAEIAPVQIIETTNTKDIKPKIELSSVFDVMPEKGIFNINGNKFELEFIAKVKAITEKSIVLNFDQSPVFRFSVDNKVSKVLIPTGMELAFVSNEKFNEAIEQNCTFKLDKICAVGEVLIDSISDHATHCCEIS